MVTAAILVTAVVALFPTCEAQAQTTIRMNGSQRLDKGQSIEVAGKGKLFMQPDGNLVLYDAANQPKWASGTYGKAVTHVIMQPDGNLVIYNGTTAVWASDTWNSNARGGYFEIDLATWSGAIRRADGTVAKVLFGTSVQLNMPNTTVAQPQSGQVQIVQGPTTTITGTPTNTSIAGNLQTAPAQPAGATTLMSGTPPPVVKPGVKCIDFSLTGSCGYEKADQLGTYALNLSCTSGFYDPIWGGTCWKCPDDDGSGPWIRSANSIQSSDACWRIPKEKTGRAIKVKDTALAWECPSGSFWDPVGACYKCPDDMPRRTATSVFASNACATSLNETKPAILVKFNGCPDPQLALANGTLTPDGKRMPGRPFLDVGAGWAQGKASGLCFACPVVDRDGNFLITDRNINPVSASNACDVRMRYTATPFTEPGMAGLATVGLIQDSKILDAAGFTMELYREALAHQVQEPKAWVATQWADVVAHPSENTYLRVAVFNSLLKAAQTPQASRSPAQQAAVAAMEKYIQNKRVYVAQAALDMYNAWKAQSDKWNATHAQSPIAQLFDYGTVPLDFLGMAAAVLAPTAGAASVLVAGSVSAQWTAGALAAVKNVEPAVPELAAVATSLQAAEGAKAATPATMRVANEVSKATTAKMVADATRVAMSARIVATIAVGAIEIATTIIAAVAMDQFISIITAQSRLEGALSTAKSQTISLSTLVSTPGGVDQLRWHFAQAVGNAPVLPEAPALLSLAQAGNAKAAATGYAVPK